LNREEYFEDIERWLNTRLWNFAIKEQAVTRDQLYRELKSFKGITLYGASKQILDETIKRVKVRVRVRFHRLKNRCDQVAADSGLPPRLILKWAVNEWVDLDDKKSIQNLVRVLNEQATFLFYDQQGRVPHDAISLDGKVPIQSILTAA
jgi:hypothetical protein